MHCDKAASQGPRGNNEMENDLKWESIKADYLEKPIDVRGILLALVAHQITVYARGAYQCMPAEAAAKLTVFNEIQHQLTSAIRRRLQGNGKGYPDEEPDAGTLGDRRARGLPRRSDRSLSVRPLKIDDLTEKGGVIADRGSGS